MRDTQFINSVKLHDGIISARYDDKVEIEMEIFLIGWYYFLDKLKQI